MIRGILSFVREKFGRIVAMGVWSLHLRFASSIVLECVSLLLMHRSRVEDVPWDWLKKVGNGGASIRIRRCLAKL